MITLNSLEATKNKINMLAFLCEDVLFVLPWAINTRV